MTTLFNLLKATSQIAPKYDVRYYLSGVNVRYFSDSKRLKISSTDGVIALQYVTATNSDFELTGDLDADFDIILDRKELINKLKLFNKKSELSLRYCAVNEQLFLDDAISNIKINIEKIDGNCRYPAIDKVIDAVNSGDTGASEIGLDLTLLANLSKQFTLATGERQAKLQIPVSARTSIKITKDKVTAVIMPCRL